MKKVLTKIGQINLPTRFGTFQMVVFENQYSRKFSSAVIVGELNTDEAVLVRVHSSCLTGDVFGSLLCDCGPQLEKALKTIIKRGQGMLIYLDQEGRGIGLGDKIRAMELQEQGLDTVDANLALGLPVDARSFQEAAEILSDFGITEVELMTNNPEKVQQLSDEGITVINRKPCVTRSASQTRKYLKTKKERMGHLLPA